MTYRSVISSTEQLALKLSVSTSLSHPEVVLRGVSPVVSSSELSVVSVVIELSTTLDEESSIKLIGVSGTVSVVYCVKKQWDKN